MLIHLTKEQTSSILRVYPYAKWIAKDKYGDIWLYYKQPFSAYGDPSYFRMRGDEDAIDMEYGLPALVNQANFPKDVVLSIQNTFSKYKGWNRTLTEIKSVN